jgi:hypothetical protein
MKWMLVVMIFGTQPVKTDLIFDTLDRCLIAEELMRSQQLEKLYSWQAAVRKTGGSFWTFWTEEPLGKRRFGLKNQATCIPHAGPVTKMD